MADKSFGVKELNLLNASGTPTVTSPNNLNLNANTVAISTSCTIGNNLTITSTTNSANLNVTGIGTLTRGFATDLSVSGISTISQPSNANPHSLWDVVNNGSSAYRFTGPGQDGAEDNPNIYLVRGQRYIFKVNASGHPFQLRVANGGAAYSDGVTNNGAQSGNVVINVQHDAPAQLYYQCTSHGGMVGNIYIVGGPQVISGVVTATTFVGNLTGNVTGTASANAVLTGSTNNTLVTVTGANAITGESTLTFNGTDLEIQPTSAAPALFIGDSNRTGAGQGLVHFRGNWNGTTVARITIDTGDDTTNKDDGIIRFDTSSTGSLVERVRINRSGYLGIGNVTSPDDKVEIRTGANDQGVLIKSTGSTSNAIKFDANRSGANQGLGSIKARWNGTTVAQMYMNTGDDTSDKNDGYIIFGTESAASNGNANATERLRIASDGNLQLNNYSGNAGQGRISFGNSGPAFIEGYDSGNAGSGAYLRFQVTNNEKVRIPRDTWGLLVTDQSSTGNTGGYQTSGVSLREGGDSTFVLSGAPAVTMTRKINAGKVLDFYSNTNYAGGVYVNGANSVQLQTSSDYRLKKDISSMTDGITKIKLMNPIYYKNNTGFDTTTIQNGFLAHEVQSVIPTLVDGEKDAPIDEKGKGYQTMNYAGLTPTLTAAVKELIAKVETLEAEVAALKGS